MYWGFNPVWICCLCSRTVVEEGSAYLNFKKDKTGMKVKDLITIVSLSG